MQKLSEEQKLLARFANISDRMFRDALLVQEHDPQTMDRIRAGKKISIRRRAREIRAMLRG